ncbi:Amidohydrolase [Pigmentiphaga humi]|uniref:Amidohydrolase n=1 Tax=Pigmentiphaga humi TaxID=2478468 RepID=A0A3P4AY91_9BURK|nr:amidohydrolase family protein [Pigmentiphaga humi]VCU69039.1 Amidohydrolase [Pigmentiphaga humi]
MLIVDAQVHTWSEGVSTGHHRRDPIDHGVMVREMAEAGVDRVVLVPPLWDPNGNAYAVQMARAEPEKFSVMGLLDPARGDAAERLARWRDQPHVRGVRFLLNTPERLQPLQEGLLDPLWPIAEAQNIAVAVLAPGQLPAVRAIASRHPGLRLIVDHLAVPRGAVGPRAFEHLPALLGLAELPNVYVKAAGVGDYAFDPFPFASLQEPLERIFDAFGAGRVVWGSDLSRLHHPYAQCVEHFKHHLPFLGQHDLARVMGLNMLQLLNWR